MRGHQFQDNEERERLAGIADERDAKRERMLPLSEADIAMVAELQRELSDEEQLAENATNLFYAGDTDANH